MGGTEPLCYRRLNQGNVVTDIFREVDEDLKRDQAVQLWKRYGKYAVVFAVATVLATAGIVGWQNYREKQRASEGRAFALAMELVNKGDAAAASTAMSDIANQGGGYRTLALLQEAASNCAPETRRRPWPSTMGSRPTAVSSSPFAISPSVSRTASAR